MARRRVVPLLCAAVWAVAATGHGAHADPVAYRLDPAHSFVHFEVLHFGTSTLRGRFGPIDGRVVLDPAAGTGELGLRIDMSTLDTGVRPLDARLREADLFDTRAHPDTWFVARQFRYDGDRVIEVRGELTLRGRSLPLALRALRYGCRHDTRLQREVCGGDFEGELLRSDAGLDFGLPFVGNRVRLQVQVEGLREP